MINMFFIFFATSPETQVEYGIFSEGLADGMPIWDSALRNLSD